jgi:hypothetical protein
MTRQHDYNNPRYHVSKISRKPNSETTHGAVAMGIHSRYPIHVDVHPALLGYISLSHNKEGQLLQLQHRLRHAIAAVESQALLDASDRVRPSMKRHHLPAKHQPLDDHSHTTKSLSGDHVDAKLLQYLDAGTNS